MGHSLLLQRLFELVGELGVQTGLWRRVGLLKCHRKPARITLPYWAVGRVPLTVRRCERHGREASKCRQEIAPA